MEPQTVALREQSNVLAGVGEELQALLADRKN